MCQLLIWIRRLQRCTRQVFQPFRMLTDPIHYVYFQIQLLTRITSYNVCYMKLLRVTYKNMGVDFDKIYYESDTYITGRDMVFEGLEKGAFYQREDKSIWCDFTAEGLDEKLLLRTDGTSVYITQDIGTAKLRFDDYKIDKMVYVVGNEQIYHFKILALLLDKLGFDWGKDLMHFSYGMVELPEGKMKSREGTVVDSYNFV